MKVIVNGSSRELRPDVTVRDVITVLGHDASGRGLAVAVNGEVVPRSQWQRSHLTEGDRIEVLTAVGGG